MAQLQSSKRILVVDDDPDVSSIIAEFLQRTGSYEVKAVTDSTEALDLASSFRPDLVVLDIVMPGLDGGDLLAAMRDVPELADVQAIFLTGLVTEAEVGTSGTYRAGHPVIAKPVRAEPFRRLVAEVLGAA